MVILGILDSKKSGLTINQQGKRPGSGFYLKSQTGNDSIFLDRLLLCVYR